MRISFGAQKPMPCTSTICRARRCGSTCSCCRVHNCVRSKANDAQGRQRLAHYMIRGPFALNKMSFNQNSGMVINRSKLRATLKRKTAHARRDMAAAALEPRPG